MKVPDSSPPSPPLLTPKEVAARLGVTVETVWHYIQTGVLPAFDLSMGTRPTYRIQPADLENFLTNRAVAVTQLHH